MTADTKFTGMTLNTVPRDIVPVSTADADLPLKAFGLYVVGAGDLAIRTGLSGSTTRTIAVLANTTIYCEVIQVRSATTATGIHALIA